MASAVGLEGLLGGILQADGATDRFHPAVTTLLSRCSRLRDTGGNRLDLGRRLGGRSILCRAKNLAHSLTGIQ